MLEPLIDAPRTERSPAETVHPPGCIRRFAPLVDGRDSIEDMVRASGDLGYEYVAITDHSQSYLAARSLRPDDVRVRRRMSRV